MIGSMLSMITSSCTLNITQASTYGSEDIVDDAQTTSDELEFIAQEGI